MGRRFRGLPVDRCPSRSTLAGDATRSTSTASLIPAPALLLAGCPAKNPCFRPSARTCAEPNASRRVRLPCHEGRDQATSEPHQRCVTWAGLNDCVKAKHGLPRTAQSHYGSAATAGREPIYVRVGPARGRSTASSRPTAHRAWGRSVRRAEGRRVALEHAGRMAIGNRFGQHVVFPGALT
jgi:hypothetical protein